MLTIHNCHTHIFTKDDVPNGLFPRIIRSRNDLLDRVAAIITMVDHDNQENIFKILIRYYPQGTKFVLLAMNMEHMGAGPTDRPFAAQLEGLLKIKQAYPDQAYPFIFVDPRQKRIVDLVKQYIEEHHFQGIKIYPPLGYYPFALGPNESFEHAQEADPVTQHARVMHKIYEYASQKQIPIMTHCSRGGIYAKHKITDQMRIHPLTGEKLKKAPRHKFTDVYTDPENYKQVLERFPDLKICLAHFGGNDEWEKYLVEPWRSEKKKNWNAAIMDLIRGQKYPNVYTDISYVSHDPRLHPVLKVTIEDEDFQDHILFGSDFYMVQLEKSERDFSMGLRGFFGQQTFKQIAEINAKRFLGI